MREDGRFFCLTSEGRSIWATRDKVRLPLDYRRILGLVNYCGYASVIRSHLGRFATSQVDAWLLEFEGLRLIELAPYPQPSLQIGHEVLPPPIEPEDKAFYDDILNFADVSLSQLGVYLPYERISHRPPSLKVPQETLALVVEDDPDQLALAKRRLGSAGYLVETVDCIAALWRYLERKTPDAIFLDINLPDGDGFEVLVRLRGHPLFTQLPIVMLTARRATADVAKGLALAADGYVTKPYGANTLDYVLRYLMQQEVEVT